MRQDYANKFSEISPVDWARLAAFIDGEGSICIKAIKNAYGGARHQPVIQITNTDESLPLWLSDTFKVGHIQLRKRVGKWSPSYDWFVRGRTATALLKGCLPYFVIKRDQADVIMRFDSLGYYRCGSGRAGRGERLVPELVQQRDALKMELHGLKKRGRFDEFKSKDKLEVVRYA